MTQMNMTESTQDSQVRNTEDQTIVIPEQVPESASSGKTRFEDLGLPSEILAATKELGFEYCTPIQEAILSQVIDGGDAAGQSQTGTGKSAAFLISIMTRLLRQKQYVPYRIGKTVLVVYAGMNGYTDEIDPKNIEDFTGK